MFSKQVVFILGAGASYEVGLPLGTELTRRVAESMDIRSPLLSGLRIGVGSAEAAAAERLHNALPTFDSIDEALHWLSDDPIAVELGKIGIANEIMNAERSSALYNAKDDGRPELSNVDNTWLPTMLSMLISGLKRTDADNIRLSVTFINFNYDRSLEHYLFWALHERALMEKEQAQKLVEKIEIIRPYGGLGKLWAEGNTYGQISDPVVIAKRIRTFTEQRNEEIGTQIKRVMLDSRVIVFLGFGFHTQNLDALTIEADNEPARHIFGTVKNINHRNHGPLTHRLISTTKSIGGSPVVLDDTTAKELLYNLKPSIIAAAN